MNDNDVKQKNAEIKEKIRHSINFEDKFREWFPELHCPTGNSFNPFVSDTKPSFKLYDDHGCDFGNDKKSYDVFALYQLKYNCDFKTALAGLKAEAGIIDPPKKSKALSTDKQKFTWKDGKEVAAYDYQDENGQLLYQNVRFEPKDPSKWPKGTKTFLQRRPDPNRPGEWIWGLDGIKPLPFGLPKLLAAPKNIKVYFDEGEKDVEAMRKIGLVATSVGSASTGPGNLTTHKLVDYFKGRDVVFVQDKDKDGRDYTAKAAPLLAKVAKSLKIIEMPGEGIKDPADLFEAHGMAAKEMIEMEAALADEWKPGVEEEKNTKEDSSVPSEAKKTKPEKLSKFQKLNLCFQGLGWKLFFDQSGEPWASVKIDDHYENIQVNSRKFRRLIRKEFMAQFEDGIGFDTIEQVVDARLGGIEYSQAPRHLHVRMCWNVTKDKILIDSGRPDWAVFEIGPDGWRMIETDENPFKRARKTAAYSCTPDTPKATWDDLFKFLRVRDDSQKTILKMWLCLALFPNTSRPGLVITGPHGSAKTTIARKMKMIVDPAVNDKPNKFRKNEDDMIAPLANYAVSVLDNANQMTPEQSDLLCLSITGLDDEKRALFTDGDIHNTEFMSTWIVTGLNNPGKMGDFLSRVFLLETSLLNKKEKIHDDEINKLAGEHTPGIQALIFDCMALALKQAKDVKATELHRLAQANLYSLAMAEGLKLNQEQIQAVWESNRADQDAEVGAGEILSDLLPRFFNDPKLGLPNGTWIGTARELHEQLYCYFEVDKKSWKKSFPPNDVHLSRRLNKIRENLSNQGITFESHGREKTFHVIGVYDSQKDKEYREAKEAAQAQLSEYSSAHECITCGYYQGNDYCSQTDGLADPDNCPLDNISPTLNSETTSAVC